MIPWTFLAVLAVWGTVFAGLKLLISPPIPASVVIIYMVLVTVALVVFVLANERRLKAFLAPLRSVFEGRAPLPLQALVIAGLPALLAWGGYQRLAPTHDAPFEPRVIHPQPPTSFKLHGTALDLAGLKNPLRKGELGGRVAEGKAIYYQNCFFCHGDALAGDGPFANAFRPLPANFRDIGTISMLQESFVFWRVATGGPGLPKGATPWNSAMPIWQTFLSEEEIWKVILYIYAGSGSTPRTWEEGSHASH